MFDYISGKLASLSADACVIDTQGIGWSLILSAKSAAHFSGKENVRAYTYLNVGSSDRAAMELYGFATEREREFFIRLIAVSGIGPKAAISVLSALTPEELAMCILSGDAKAICAAQGVGMKGAQKIILELKDKIAKTSSAQAAAPQVSSAPAGMETEAVNALVVLGYPPATAAGAVRAVKDKASDLQGLIRLALKSMGE